VFDQRSRTTFKKAWIVDATFPNNKGALLASTRTQRQQSVGSVGLGEKVSEFGKVEKVTPSRHNIIVEKR
jgi:hypothetical protein